MTAMSKRQRALLNIYKKQKKSKPFFIQKDIYFAKKQDNLRCVFILYG